MKELCLIVDIKTVMLIISLLFVKGDLIIYREMGEGKIRKEVCQNVSGMAMEKYRREGVKKEERK